MRPVRYPGPIAEEHRFVAWLASATDERILGATPADLREVYRFNLDVRWMECKLLAEQGKRRRAKGSQQGETVCPM